MRRLFILLALSVGTANAAVVSINAQLFGVGTDISNVTPGATLSEITN